MHACPPSPSYRMHDQRVLLGLKLNPCLVTLIPHAHFNSQINPPNDQIFLIQYIQNMGNNILKPCLKPDNHGSKFGSSVLSSNEKPQNCPVFQQLYFKIAIFDFKITLYFKSLLFLWIFQYFNILFRNTPIIFLK